MITTIVSRRTRWTVRVVLIAGLAGLLAACGSAAEKGNVFTDPAEAGPDFQAQGEYVGQIQADNGQLIDFGAQIIALGEGKFQGVGYRGGLPGAGWDQSECILADGQRKGGAVVFETADGRRAELKDGVIKVLEADRSVLGTLKRVERRSPTLGDKPPAGAVVLFDGTSAESFKGGRITPDGLLMEGATSKQTFQSFALHLEFRTPFMPAARGQGRGNSGFYAQGRYEVQILDSFGLEGRNNECGGIYSVAPPSVNMCLPPLSWQSFDVEFTAAEYEGGRKVKNARMSVRHNGVLIHDNVELPHATTAAPVKEGPEPGPIFLQNHGCPVRFRNIWVVPRD